jgi:hypothetical protein
MLPIPLAALTILGVSGMAFAQDPDPEPDVPSLAQICAATGVAEIDTLLETVAETEAADLLKPIVDVIVSSVQLEEIRSALNCDEVVDDDEPDPDPVPEDDNDPSDDVVIPKRIDTGGGPA